MSGNSRKTPGTTNPKLKLGASGTSNNGGKPDVNLVSAQGEIVSPTGFPSRRQSGQSSPTQRLNNNAINPSKVSDLKDHPLYDKVQTLGSDLQPFLYHDWYTNKEYNLTKLKYYSILHHFNPATSARPTQRKDLLEAKFRTDLLDKLLPFCKPPPSHDTMDTEEDQEDYDPLHRSTTITMLVNTIKRINRNVNVSSVALKDEVLVLYKYYVNPNLQLRQTSSYTTIPRIVKSSFVPKLSTQAIRHALQCRHPELFLNTPVLRLSHYISFYRLLIIEEEQKPNEEALVQGYHYWIIKDLLPNPTKRT